MDKLLIDSIFNEYPEGWGALRGDPYLWNIIRGSYFGWTADRKQNIEVQTAEVKERVEHYYRLLTGKELKGEGEDFSKWLDLVAKGMSHGMVTQSLWQKTIPILQDRLEELVGDVCGKHSCFHTKLLVLKGDLLKRKEDALVNPTKPELISENGLSGAIFKAGGAGLRKACANRPSNENGEKCSVGDSCATVGGNLPNRYVIHTVGPACHRGVTEEARGQLRSCYVSCLNCARRHDLKSIAIPSISTGKNAFPLEEAAKIMADVLVREAMCASFEKVVFCCADDETLEIYRKACEDRVREVLPKNCD